MIDQSLNYLLSSKIKDLYSKFPFLGTRLPLPNMIVGGFKTKEFTVELLISILNPSDLVLSAKIFAKF